MTESDNTPVNTVSQQDESVQKDGAVPPTGVFTSAQEAQPAPSGPVAAAPTPDADNNASAEAPVSVEPTPDAPSEQPVASESVSDAPSEQNDPS